METIFSVEKKNSCSYPCILFTCLYIFCQSIISCQNVRLFSVFLNTCQQSKFLTAINGFMKTKKRQSFICLHLWTPHRHTRRCNMAKWLPSWETWLNHHWKWFCILFWHYFLFLQLMMGPLLMSISLNLSIMHQRDFRR